MKSNKQIITKKPITSYCIKSSSQKSNNAVILTKCDCTDSDPPSTQQQDTTKVLRNKDAILQINPRSKKI